ncbi:MAG TPA: dihydroorotase, partial [Deferribacteraceae bacterium]|nr:dihydroorotase [Deferribacteraceae bacterium]
KLTGGHVHICHISTRDAVDLVRWGKAKGIKVTCEVTPHHFTLTEKELLGYDTNCKMNPPLRTADDVQAMKEGLKDGTIDCIATDHAPHARDEKFQEFDLAPFGITGLQTMVPLTLNLVREGVINENDFARLCSYAPAQLLRQKGRGVIEEGAMADIAVIDPDKEYVFDAKLNKSKSTNSPFMGKTLKGLCVLTFKNGKEVYKADI